MTLMSGTTRGMILRVIKYGGSTFLSQGLGPDVDTLFIARHTHVIRVAFTFQKFN